MSAALQVDLTFDQVLDLVKQLPTQEKIKLTKVLEQEVIATKLSDLLEKFRTEDLSEDVINEEAEIVRQQLYDGQKQ